MIYKLLNNFVVNRNTAYTVKDKLFRNWIRMMKKLLVITCVLFFLVACGKKDDIPQIDIKGPAIGPDVTKVTPDYGPNDPEPIVNQ